MNKYIFILILGLSVHNTLAEDLNDSLRYQKQFSILVDNDVFTSLFRDQYYSSGIFGIYRWSYNSNEEIKKIRSVAIVQRIFTPRLVTWGELQQLDRPYAGQLSMIMTQEHLRSKSIWKHELELGWMGPGSLTGKIQENWHRTFGMPAPQGWKYQIQNSPIINYYGTYGASLYALKTLELLSETHVALGTAFTNARQEVMLRFGKFKTLNKSVQYQAQLHEMKPHNKIETAEEFVLFYAPGIEYNFYNSTIEGNLIGKPAPHIEEALRWIKQNRFGLCISWHSFDLIINYYRRSKETTEALPHQYAGIQLNQRF